jgi:hypothetical protein
MVDNEVVSLQKISGFYLLRTVESLISTYVIMGIRDCIDFVDVGTDNVDEVTVIYYLGY